MNIFRIEGSSLFCKAIILCAVGLLTACHAFNSAGEHYLLLAEYELPDELKETSGLFCPEEDVLFTLNDSGNKPQLYKINAFGEILDRRTVDAKNTDWEALTGDDTHFYIGDIGNNRGMRKFVQVHSVAKDTSTQAVTTSNIVYLNNSIDSNEYLNHDFDAEALVSIDTSLYLFSKSWHTGTLLVYQLDDTAKEQTAEHFTEVKNLPGVITGGDYDQKHKRFILVGYELKGLGRFYPFMAILDQQLNLVRSFQLQSYDQVEGVCVTPNGDVWFTQEASFYGKQRLVKIEVP